MAIDFNAPSQVRPYANLGAFPATGAVKTIYIAEDTNYIYRWNGTAYIEISVADLVGYVPYTGATEDLNLGNYDAYVNKLWLYDSVNDNYGSVHFTDTDFHIEDADGHKMLVIEDGFIQLHKTDTIQSNLYTSGLTATRDHYLPNASGTIALTSDLSSYVPTSRTLTINGVTQDLSADRTFTISTGITIGTTAITSGTDGRILFQNGGVVSQSANLFFDVANGRLGIGGTPSSQLTIAKTGSNNYFNFEPSATGTSPYIQGFFAGGIDGRIYFGNKLQLRTAGSTNLYGLDAGTVSATNFECLPATATQAYLYLSGAASNNSAIYFRETGVAFRGAIGFEGGSADFQIRTNLSGATTWSGNERLRIFGATGNIGINVSGVDAGFKADINGTLRVQGNVTMTSGTSLTVGSIQIFDDTGGTRVIQALSNQGLLVRAGSNVITLRNSASGGDATFSTTGSYTIQPNGITGSGGINIFGSSSAPSSTTISFKKIRNDGAKSGIINSEDFAVSGSAPINLFIYAGKETVLNNQANLILCHDGTTTRGNTLIGTTTNVASAIVNVESTTQGVLFPRMTTTQKNAISAPATGLMVYDTTLNLMALYNGTTWTTL
jgi:hypothetical protein